MKKPSSTAQIGIALLLAVVMQRIVGKQLIVE